MKFKTLLPALIVIFLFAGFQAVSAQSGDTGMSMKGYELYSWKYRGEWYFSVLVGTNRRKIIDEIVSPKVRLRGVPALKKKLDRLPKGAEVIMSTGSHPQLVLPGSKIMKEIMFHCERGGIVLTVSTVRAKISGKKIRFFDEHASFTIARQSQINAA